TFTLVSGLAGRFYLSGFLDRLRPDQMRAVADAVSLHRQQVERLRYAVPFWPLGLPAWDDELICSGLRDGDDVLLFVWARAERASEFVLPARSSLELGGSCARPLGGSRSRRFRESRRASYARAGAVRARWGTDADRTADGSRPRRPLLRSGGTGAAAGTPGRGPTCCDDRTAGRRRAGRCRAVHHRLGPSRPGQWRARAARP